MNPIEVSTPLRFRCIVQRVSAAEVFVADASRGRIGTGLVVLFGVGSDPAGWTPDCNANALLKSSEPRLQWLVDKILALRIFEDAAGKMNLSLTQLPQAGIYAISQFTLFANSNAGNRPSFTSALKPEFAQPLYDHFVALLSARVKALTGLTLHTGIFGADMQVSLINDGPVSLLLER